MPSLPMLLPYRSSSSIAGASATIFPRLVMALRSSSSKKEVLIFFGGDDSVTRIGISWYQLVSSYKIKQHKSSHGTLLFRQ